MRFQSEGHIRQSLIKQTPFGSSPELVLNFLKNYHYKNFGGSEPKYNKGPAIAHDQEGKCIFIGKRSIGPILLDHYSVPVDGFQVEMCVLVFWAFDEKDKLINVLVSKELDTP